MKPVRLSELAEAEALEAAVEIDEAREGWGQKFLDELEDRRAYIAKHPNTPPDLPNRPGRKMVRLKRFPYWMIYRIDDDEIEVLAVAHDRRRPGYWHERDADESD